MSAAGASHPVLLYRPLMRATTKRWLQTLRLGNCRHQLYSYRVQGFWRGDPARQYLGADVPPLGGPPDGMLLHTSAEHEPRPYHEVPVTAAMH
jgi:hypothetical protein